MATEHRDSLSDSMSSLDSLEDAYYKQSSTCGDSPFINVKRDEVGNVDVAEILNISEREAESECADESSEISQERPNSSVKRICHDDLQIEGESMEWTIADDGSRSEFEKLASDSEDADIPAPPGSDESSGKIQRSGDPRISMCGMLNISLQYILSEKKFVVCILEAKELPVVNRGGSNSVEVHALVLPKKKKRFRTKPQQTDSLRFLKTFKLTDVSPEKLSDLGFRFRVYAMNKLVGRSLIGEASISSSEINLLSDSVISTWLQLEPRAEINRGETGFVAAKEKSVAALSYGGASPEILLSLSYEKQTGRLSVGVEKASHFHDRASSKPPDTFVKASLLNASYQEMARSRTSIRRSQPSPTFKESFYFQVAHSQLGEVTLLVSVHRKMTLGRKSQLGWVSLGASASGEAEQQHWSEMKRSGGEQVLKWHDLLRA